MEAGGRGGAKLDRRVRGAGCASAVALRSDKDPNPGPSWGPQRDPCAELDTSRAGQEEEAAWQLCLFDSECNAWARVPQRLTGACAGTGSTAACRGDKGATCAVQPITRFAITFCSSGKAGAALAYSRTSRYLLLGSESAESRCSTCAVCAGRVLEACRQGKASGRGERRGAKEDRVTCWVVGAQGCRRRCISAPKLLVCALPWQLARAAEGRLSPWAHDCLGMAMARISVTYLLGSDSRDAEVCSGASIAWRALHCRRHAQHNTPCRESRMRRNRCG
jgi:hypothetical protein